MVVRHALPTELNEISYDDVSYGMMKRLQLFGAHTWRDLAILLRVVTYHMPGSFVCLWTGADRRSSRTAHARCNTGSLYVAAIEPRTKMDANHW